MAPSLQDIFPFVHDLEMSQKRKFGKWQEFLDETVQKLGVSGKSAEFRTCRTDEERVAFVRETDMLEYVCVSLLSPIPQFPPPSLSSVPGQSQARLGQLPQGNTVSSLTQSH